MVAIPAMPVFDAEAARPAAIPESPRVALMACADGSTHKSAARWLSSSADAAITCATIAMARQLGLRVVAEGVEEQGQMDFLNRYGCSEYQGFLFSPAVPADVFAELLRSGIEAGPRAMPRS